MKKSYQIVLIIGIVILIVACGRSRAHMNDNSNKSSENSSSETRIKLNDNKWPENEYTANIPQPSTGEVTGSWIDAGKKYCFVELNDINQSESEDYINTLKNLGFKNVVKVSEKNNTEEFAGVLLSKDNVSINISYTGDLLCMYINTN